MKLLLPLLAAVTLFAVGFVLIELHAPMTPRDGSPPTLPLSPPPTVVAPPAAAPPAAAPPVAAPPVAAPPPPVAARPLSPSSDPLDVVVRGRSRRDWHAYYADRQQQIAAEMQRYQAIVDRAIAGEEPDPRELAKAHDKIGELNTRLKEDLEALQQIDGTP